MKHAVLLTALLMGMLAGAGCSATDGEKALEEGKRLLTSKDPADWEKGIEAFKRSITTEILARDRLATSLIRLGTRQINDADQFTVGREDEMARLLEGGIARHLAMREMEYSFYNNAVTNLETAARILPNDKNSYYLLGLAYGQLSRGKLDPGESDALLLKADASYRVALKLDPEYTSALYGHSIVLILLKRYPDAEQVCQRLIQLEPGETRGYFALARVYYEAEEYRKAENMYRVLLEILPAKSPRRALVEENLRKLDIASSIKR